MKTKKITDLDIQTALTDSDKLICQTSEGVMLLPWSLVFNKMEIDRANRFSESGMVNMALAGSAVALGENYRSFFMKVKPGEVYSISRESDINNRFSAVFTNREPNGGVPYFGGTGIEGVPGLEMEDITVPENANYLFLYLSNRGDEIPRIIIKKRRAVSD